MSTPNATIKFYQVYDLTPDYTHTRYFGDSGSRDSYFDARVGQTISPTQYIRVDEGEVKVPLPIKEVHDYCYMSIQNSRGSGVNEHRYYCFIIDMDYVSDMCTLVKYKVDVMQTFAMDGMFSSTMPNQNFVARCHNDTDNIGDNLVQEPFNCDDYHESDQYVSSTVPYEVTIVIGVNSHRMVTIGGNQIQCKPRYYTNNIYTGAMYFAFDNDASGEALLNDFFGNQGFQGYEDEIISMYAVPSFMIPRPLLSGCVIGQGISNYNCYFSQGVDETNGFEGYIPKNKKLYTSPFTMLRVTNFEGDKVDLAFELFHQTDYGLKFELDGAYIGEPSLAIYPVGYNSDSSANNKPNYDYGISIGGYASGTWSKNALSGYIVKHGLANLIKMLTNVVTIGAIGGLFGNVESASSGTALVTQQKSVLMQYQDYGGAVVKDNKTASAMGAYTLYNSAHNLANLVQAKHTSDITFGKTQGTIAQQNAFKNFYFKRIKIRKYLAEQIDNYFTMFGYAQNKLMNIGYFLSHYTRTVYCYMQCENFAVVNASVENKFKVEIAKIMNNGITFWFNGAVIGNYNATP